MDIKIVPFGGSIGSMGSPVRINTQKMQDFIGTSSKRVGSRGIISRGGRPSPGKPNAIDSMQPAMPKYTYTEERPQTRGNNSQTQTAGGTRGGRR